VVPEAIQKQNPLSKEVFKVKKSLKISSLSFVVGLSLFASSSNSAFAEFPLSQILDSVAGRYIFGETPRGAAAAARLLGQDLPLLERNTALRTVLEDPSHAAQAVDLQARLNRIHEALRLQSPDVADALFSTGAAASRPLTAAEVEVLRTAARFEFTPSMIEALPQGQVTSSVAARRQAFVDGVKVGQSVELPMLARWEIEGTTSLSATTFQAYKQAVTLTPALQRMMNPADIYAILSDDEMSRYTTTLKKVLDAMTADASNASPMFKLKNAFKVALKDQVPNASIPGRILALQKGGLPELKRALGDMTIDEVRIFVHGGNPLQPTPESLLGRYLQETGAQSVVRAFPKGPAQGEGATNEKGPQRLVVAVGPESIATYQKYFGNPHLLAHLHTPSQGTLSLAHNGKVGYYANLNEEMRFPRAGTLIPQILLSTTEAQRVTQFFKLGAKPGNYALTPWRLDGYCARGAYESCTHWFGNIPIGDQRVAEYQFPGAVDGHADNRLPSDPAPRVQALGPYLNDSRLMNRVWKVPGNMQLADVIGLHDANLRGELANPGWVLISLTGSTPVDRVPVVFFAVGDHRVPLAPDFQYDVHAY
jgi:hypothetical protein